MLFELYTVGSQNPANPVPHSVKEEVRKWGVTDVLPPNWDFLLDIKKY